MSEETNPQSAFWNGQSGLTWVEGQPFLDEAFSGCVPVLTAAVEASGAKRLLDIGCGTGAVSQLVRNLGTARIAQPFTGGG